MTLFLGGPTRRRFPDQAIGEWDQALAEQSPPEITEPKDWIAADLLARFPDFGNPANAGLLELLGECVPDTPYRQMTSNMLIKELVPSTGNVRVLDLGCGNAKSKPLFMEHNPGTRWQGVEIAASYNLKTGERPPDGVKIYDGINIPFGRKSFEFCYSNQVFEHVEHPRPLLENVHRVLTDDGRFFGALSGGEPYHWHSLYNYTALGWKRMLEASGFELLRLYAGVDALTLLLHHWTPNRRQMGAYFSESPLNAMLNAETAKTTDQIRYINALKLAFAGHLVFVARKKPRSRHGLSGLLPR